VIEVLAAVKIIHEALQVLLAGFHFTRFLRDKEIYQNWQN